MATAKKKVATVTFIDSAPPRQTRRGKNAEMHQEIADLLRENEGQWAQLGLDSMSEQSRRSLASTISNGRSVFGPEGEFAAVSRSINGEVVVFAAFNPVYEDDEDGE